jgi:hypothetical protein
MRWLFEPVPKGRIAAFRTLVYLFVAADLVVFTPWVRHHADTPGELYQPLLVGRLLHLPTPTPLLVHGIFWLLLGASVAACSWRWPHCPPWAGPGTATRSAPKRAAGRCGSPRSR